MFTICSCPKAFRNHSNIIQRNAIKSWLLLQPRPEIILLGDDGGTAEICRELNLKHIPEIAKNKNGTPLVNSIFSEAEKAAKYPLMCYVNTDIILLSDFTEVIVNVTKQFDRFMLVGQRWDLDIDKELNFSGDWKNNLRLLLKQKGKVHAYTGIDYFIFPKGLFSEVLPFVLGRTIWDNWLIYRARQLKIPVVDLTEAVMIVHQNHNYGRFKKADIWYGEEARKNLILAGGYGHTFNIAHASYKFTQKGLEKNLTLSRLYWELNRFIWRSLKIGLSNISY